MGVQHVQHSWGSPRGPHVVLQHLKPQVPKVLQGRGVEDWGADGGRVRGGYGTVLYGTARYGMVWNGNGMVWYGVIWYGLVWAHGSRPGITAQLLEPHACSPLWDGGAGGHSPAACGT